MSFKRLIPGMLMVFAILATFVFCLYVLLISILSLATWSNAFSWDLIIAVLGVSAVVGIISGSIIIVCDWEGFKDVNS